MGTETVVRLRGVSLAAQLLDGGQRIGHADDAEPLPIRLWDQLAVYALFGGDLLQPRQGIVAPDDDLAGHDERTACSARYQPAPWPVLRPIFRRAHLDPRSVGRRKDGSVAEHSFRDIGSGRKPDL